MLTDKQAEVLRLWDELGGKRGAIAEIARRMGMDGGNVSKMLAVAQKKQRLAEEEPQGVTEALTRLGAQGAAGVWVKDKGASAYWRRASAESDPQALLDAIREGLTDVPRAVHMDPPSGPSDLLAVFPVADLHIGMLADEEEAGTAWDTKIAVRTFEDVFTRLVALTPPAGAALLAQLGDLLHASDQTNATPQSKHQLDVDTRFFKSLRRAVAVMRIAIDLLRARYPRVVYRGAVGNHDLHIAHAVTLALAEHYRDTPSVQIVQSAAPFYVHQFGRNMLILHHGDRARPEQVAHYVAAEFAQVWGQTTHRLALSGHWHREAKKEVGGLICESFGTLIPKDAYAAASGYTSRRGLVSLTLNRDDGEVSRARVGVA